MPGRKAFWLLVFVFPVSSHWPSENLSDSCTGPRSDSCSTTAANQNSPDADRWLQTDETSLMHLSSKVTRRSSESEASASGAKREAGDRTTRIFGTTALTRLSFSQARNQRLKSQKAETQRSKDESARIAQTHLLAWVMLLGVVLIAIAFCLVLRISAEDQEVASDGKLWDQISGRPPGAQTQGPNATLEAGQVPSDELGSPRTAPIRPSPAFQSMASSLPQRHGFPGDDFEGGIDPKREGIVPAGQKMKVFMCRHDGSVNKVKFEGEELFSEAFPISFGRRDPPGQTEPEGIVKFQRFLDMGGDYPEEAAYFYYVDPDTPTMMDGQPNRVQVGQAQYRFTSSNAFICSMERNAEDDPPLYCSVTKVQGQPGGPRCIYQVADKFGKHVLDIEVQNPGPPEQRQVFILHAVAWRQKHASKGANSNGLVAHAKVGANVSEYEVRVYPTGDIFLSMMLTTVADRLEVSPSAEETRSSPTSQSASQQQEQNLSRQYEQQHSISRPYEVFSAAASGPISAPY